LSSQCCCHALLSPFLVLVTPRPPPGPTLFPYTTLFRSIELVADEAMEQLARLKIRPRVEPVRRVRHRERKRNQLPALVHVAEERSEEHTSELQSPYDLVCRLLLEKKKRNSTPNYV